MSTSTKKPEQAVLKYQQPKRMGLFERIRSRGAKKRVEVPADNRENTPSPPINTQQQEELRVVTPTSTPSSAREIKARKRSKLPFREEITLDKAPTARESAFSGPPRYDWIDIVSRRCVDLPRRAFVAGFRGENRRHGRADRRISSLLRGIQSTAMKIGFA